MAEGGTMNHPIASSKIEEASEEGGENDGPIDRIISCLKDVEGCLKAVEKMSSRKLNNEQCDYLIDKLRHVFESASSHFEVSRGKRHISLSIEDIKAYRGFRSRVDSARRIGVFKLILALAEQIKSFVRGCCEDAWIKSAMTLAHMSEYVLSLGTNLELCKAAYSKQGESASLTSDRDVHGIFEKEFQIVKKKALADEAKLRSRVQEQATLSGDDGQLISHLRRKLSMDQPGIAVPPSASTPNTSRSATGPGKKNPSKGLYDRGERRDTVATGVRLGDVVSREEWLGMTVATKIFEGQPHESFKNEVQIFETLCHPNVISFFCSVEGSSSCSITMELMDMDLHNLLKKLRTDDSDHFTHLEAVDLMLQVGEGVQYLHDKKIVHMDLKSMNVLIRIIKEDDFHTRYFQAKVSNFGLSKTKANSTSFSAQGYKLGTHRWMPLETIPGRGQETSSKEEKEEGLVVPKYPKKSDVYSFAMVCYEILTGNVPFYEVDRRNAKKKAKDGDRPELPKQCPPKLKHLIERCWSQDPQERPRFEDICKELKYLKYLLMTDIMVFDTTTYDNGLFTYGGDFLVDRSIARSLEVNNEKKENDSEKLLYKTMMDRVRHRLEPFPAISSTIDNNFEDTDDNNGDADDDNGDPSGNRTMGDDTSLSFSQLETFAELLIRSDVIVQIALFQTLLEERFAIPIVVPYNEDFNEFRHLLEALSFVQVKIENEEILSVAGNDSLPRVVFVSNRQTVSQRESADMACEVMNCRFPSKDIKKDIGGGPTILELGVGFLKNSADTQVLHKHCLVFCVSGDHNKLGMVLEKIADVVIIEIDPGTKPAFPSWVRGTKRKIDTFFWSIDSQRANKSSSPPHVWGKFKDLRTPITSYLLTRRKFRGKDDEKSFSLTECFHSLNPLHRPTPVSNIKKLEAIDFDKVRDSLTLQRNYNVESSHYFLSLQERRRAAELKVRMQECQEYRKQFAKVILELPVLELFVQILSEEDSTKRGVSILHFQCIIDQKLKPKLEEASKKVIVASERCQGDQNNVALKEGYEIAMNAHVNQMLGLEHLWRELSHIFVASPEKRLLPELAARHLLDGFPLEILDGDAANFNKVWVDTVLIELNRRLQTSLKREPKVFVLSVLGTQSSGKSTLLNTMFGTKLETSAGMCTRGVFLQLVKSEWPEFDYVLILDTEGLRAPEYFSREYNQGQDNRLATFAVLPADACIVMVANEDDNGLKEVLPMVMLAFKGSKVAELKGGKIQSKLFFVYRGVDVNDKAKLGKNQRKLQEVLRTASSLISETSNQGKHAGSHGASPLSTFQVNSDERISDVKFFGNLKAGTRPPKDTPDWEYGSQVENLREYIHNRVLDKGRWSAHGLLEWKTYLDMVWVSIADANFELSFSNQIDHFNYHDLQTKITKSRQKVGRECQEEFEDETKKLSAGGNIDKSKFEEHSKSFKVRLERIIKDENTVVLDFLGEVRFQRWEIAEEEKWITEQEDIKKQWLYRLKGYFDGTLRFDKIVRDYVTKIQRVISDPERARFKEYLSSERKTKMEEDFEKLFGGFVEKAKHNHPPLADKVEKSISDLYCGHPVIGKAFDFNDDAETTSKSQKFNRKDVAESTSKFPKSVWGTTKLIIDRYKNLLYSNDYAEIEVDSKLIQNVQSELRDVKQFMPYVVEKIIYITSDFAKNENREATKQMHLRVKQELVRKLTAIQKEWDSHHNVARRLEAERVFLWQSFVNYADEVDGTKMLSMSLCTLLGTDKLLDGFKDSITKSVSNSLRTREWVCNWKVLRAHLDLHLIELINSRQTQEMLNLVSDGALHYKLIVEEFISEEVHKRLEHAWKHFTGRVCNAIEDAATDARNSNSKQRPVIFQQNVIQSLTDDVSEVLARGISVTLSTEVCSQYSNDIDFKQIHEDVSAMVKKVDLDVIKFPFDEVVERVRIRLSDSNTDSARARCDSMCPRCKVTCFKPMDHRDSHNTVHQPEGLCGVHHLNSKVLSAESCSKCVQLEHTMAFINDDGIVKVPYKDWTTVYPTWVLPSEEIGSVEVREYIFAHFQKELVQKYSDYKECPDIPEEYKQHSLQTLQVNLENVV